MGFSLTVTFSVQGADRLTWMLSRQGRLFPFPMAYLPAIYKVLIEYLSLRTVSTICWSVHYSFPSTLICCT